MSDPGGGRGDRQAGEKRKEKKETKEKGNQVTA